MKAADVRESGPPARGVFGRAVDERGCGPRLLHRAVRRGPRSWRSIRIGPEEVISGQNMGSLVESGLLDLPGALGAFARSTRTLGLCSAVGGNPVGDLFPIPPPMWVNGKPVPESSAVTPSTTSGISSSRRRTRSFRWTAARSWTRAALVVLNFVHAGRCGTARGPPPPRTFTARQLQVIERVLDICVRLVRPSVEGCGPKLAWLGEALSRLETGEEQILLHLPADYREL